MDKVSISYDLVHGFPSSSILAYAEQMEADAIVLGFENESDRLKFGNITNAVIEHAKIPVIAVPQHYKASVFKKPEKILYFTQIDELDAEAIERLIRLVSFFKAQIICVHACLGESTEEEEQKMHELKNTLEKHYDSDLLECGILETGDIIEGVVKFVKKRQVDVLAMNTKKRHALLKLFTSNFTEKVLDQTHVPLLVFHVNRS
jgi:nucleotide-binding universal stress UspA family protein